MQIAILEMPAERVYRVTLDNQRIPGFVVKSVGKERWEVHWEDEHGHERQAKLSPHSREGAAMILLFHHFETERRRIEKRTAKHKKGGE